MSQKKGKVKSITLDKITNAFTVLVEWHDAGSKDAWDTISETYAYDNVHEAMEKVAELSTKI